MNLNLYGEIKGLEKGIGILSSELQFTVSENGIPVKVYHTDKHIEVSMNDGQGAIGYNKKIHFIRALGLFLEEARIHNSFSISEEPQFDTNGVMIDCSRNAVMKVESIKKLLSKMALMGLNMLMLYTEDTYTIENQPYFGYMRGRYSYDELKECDDYADIFGIEVIPCIQTLAHLTQALKWNFGNEIKDTADILLAGSEKTYEFIENMIRSASAPFRSKRIHVGMDEAHSLGLGRYLELNGYKKKLDIMTEHLNKVLEIISRHGLKPMIWSDMYSWNTKDEDDLEHMVPKNVQLVYWDYYNHSENHYAAEIKKHRRFGSDPVYAGGIWTWGGGLCMWYNKTFATANPALTACKKEGIKEVFATMWGDNGSEVNIFASMLGLQLFAEHGYAKELDTDKLKRRFKFCTNADYDDFMDLTNVDEPLGKYNPDYYYNPSKYLLWQDVLMGLFDKNVEGIDLAGHYTKMEERMKQHAAQNSEWDFIFSLQEKLCSVLKLKGDMGIRIKKYYDNKDKKALEKVAREELPELYRRVDDLRVTHMQQWLSTYKPFGWEVLDIRYGGLLARINSAILRINSYIEGNTDRLDELEEERLYFDGPKKPEDFKLTHCNEYSRIPTASPLG